MKHVTSSFQTHYGMNLFEMINKVSSKTQLQNYGSERESEKHEGFLFPQSNRISEASSSILVSGIGENLSNYESQKDKSENNNNNFNNNSKSNNGSNNNGNNKVPNHSSNNGINNNQVSVRTIKKSDHVHYDDSQTTNSKEMEFTMTSLKGNGNNAHKMHSSPNTYNKILTQPNSSKKIKLTNTNKKSKSKSKNKMIINSFNYNTPHNKQQQYPDRSPIPKSPKAHNLASSNSTANLRDSRTGIVKIKTTHRLKISTEKIEYRKEGANGNDKQRDKNLSPKVNFDYFTSKSKDLKKSINMKNSQVVQSPKVHNTSRSSSRRQSPVPNYFKPMKVQRKTIKSPRPEKLQNPYTLVKSKPKKKVDKMSFQQYYL